MKIIYYLIQHNRGNHSASQVLYHGNILMKGTKKECKAEIVRMRKFCRNKWHETSTNQKMSEFVNYEMSDIFFVKKNESNIDWA